MKCNRGTTVTIQEPRTQRHLVHILEEMATKGFKSFDGLYHKNRKLWLYLYRFVAKFGATADLGKAYPEAAWEIACQSAAEWVKYNVYKEL